MEEFYRNTARVFKALADENRVKILEMLIDGEKFAGAILEQMEVTQPTLSHHMRILCDSGLVKSRKVGRMVYYSITEQGVDRTFDTLAQAILPSDERAAVVEKKKIKKSDFNVIL